jgi:hypothetical protein
MAHDGTQSELDAEVKAAFAEAYAVSDAAFHEGNALERQGKLDVAAIEGLEARLEEASAEVDQAVARQIAKIGAPSPELARGGLSLLLRIVAVALFVLAATGFVFEMTVGTGFILFSSRDYRAAMPWLFAVLVALLGIGGLMSHRLREHLKLNYPDSGFRWVIMFPLLLLTGAGAMVVAPLGWAAAATWLAGEPTNGQVARVVSVGDLRVNSRGCDQRVELEYQGVIATICLEGRLVGPTPKAHETVLLAGRRTTLGLLIYEIRRDLP